MRPFVALGVATLLSATFCCRVSIGQTPGSTSESKVEVREGDTWTKVTAVRKEGRRTLIRYDDGVEDWVTADRLRTSGTAPQATPSAPAATEHRPAKTAFMPGDQVEFKRDRRWTPGTVDRALRGWYQVTDPKEKVTYWLEPWALRTVGAAYDIASWGSARQASVKGESAPTSAPPPAPQQSGDQFLIPGVDGAITPLGPFTEINYDNTPDPQPSTGKPLSFPTTRPAGEFGSTTIRPQYNRVDSIVPCYDTPGTALLIFGLFMDQPAEIVRLDVSTRRQIDKRIVDAPRYRVTGAADGGNTMLAVPAEFFPKTLHLLELKGGQYKLKANFKPFTNNFPHIIQAALLSPARAVVVNSAGEGYVLDLSAARGVGYIKLKPGTTFFVHPTGQLIGGLTAAGTALLLRPDDFSTVAEFRDVAGRGNITVDPSGTHAAYIGSGDVIRIVKIADGAAVGSIQVKGDFSGRLELLSPEALLVEHRDGPFVEHPTVYDTRVGMPLWIYDAPKDTKRVVLASGQVLLAAVDGDMAAACVATLPDAAARSAIKNASKDSFLLAPGTAIQVEGNFSAFGADADKAREIVQAAVKTAGLVVSDQPQPIRLAVSAARGPTEKRDIQTDAWNSTPILQSVVAPSNIVTVALVHQGATVWSQELRYQLQGAIRLEQGQTLQEAAIAAARITAGGLSQLTVPSYLPRGAAPGAPAALGASQLTARGFSPVPMPKPQPQPSGPSRPNIPVPPARRMPSNPAA